MFVSVLYLTIGFLVLILRVFIFTFLGLIAQFINSFCFLVELSYHWKLHLKKRIVVKKHSVRKTCLKVIIVLFDKLKLLGWYIVLSKNLVDFLPMFVFVFVVVRNLAVTDNFQLTAPLRSISCLEISVGSYLFFMAFQLNF